MAARHSVQKQKGLAVPFHFVIQLDPVCLQYAHRSPSSALLSTSPHRVGTPGNSVRGVFFSAPTFGKFQWRHTLILRKRKHTAPPIVAAPVGESRALRATIMI